MSRNRKRSWIVHWPFISVGDENESELGCLPQSTPFPTLNRAPLSWRIFIKHSFFFRSHSKRKLWKGILFVFVLMLGKRIMKQYTAVLMRTWFTCFVDCDVDVNAYLVFGLDYFRGLTSRIFRRMVRCQGNSSRCLCSRCNASEAVHITNRAVCNTSLEEWVTGLIKQRERPVSACSGTSARPACCLAAGSVYQARPQGHRDPQY